MISILSKLKHKPSKSTLHRVALQYLLSRLENMASIGDPAYDLLFDLARELQVQLNLPYATSQLRTHFGNDLCYCLERILTGQEWIDDRGKLVGS